jgi:hypothetical protein
MIGYFVWYKLYIKEKIALCSTPVSGFDLNAVGNMLCGTGILVYSNTGEWFVCKANNIEGYTASKYILLKQDFQNKDGKEKK